jgi:hypothetical protein
MTRHLICVVDARGGVRRRWRANRKAPAAGSVAAERRGGGRDDARRCGGGQRAAPTGPVGDLVSAQWDDGSWYPGKIGAVNADGTYRVNYTDGDVSKALPARKVRARKPSSGGSSGGGCSGGRTKCGGRCVDLLNDNHNCNSCGRECPEACMGGSCVSNAYKYGE